MLRRLGSLLLIGVASRALAGDVIASPPEQRSVTVYRAPGRDAGAIDTLDPAGYALVTETRSVSFPAGESRVEFQGVADGLDPASVVVSGLPAELLEKNRDADLLTGPALLRVNVGQRVTLRRTNARTGAVSATPVTVRAAAGDAVVFDGPDGVEALSCAGLAEQLLFDTSRSLTGVPTLSMRIRSDTPGAARVTLSYLAARFDWAASYSVTLSPDEKSMDLGAWVTLANGNATGFPRAAIQVVAGRVNRVEEGATVEPDTSDEAAIGRCWPLGTTSDVASQDAGSARGVDRLEEIIVTGARRKLMEAPPPMALAMAAPAVLVTQEQLGDLKLYRVPQGTTLAARQSKQVRLLERARVPVRVVYGVEAGANQMLASQPATRWVRSRTDQRHGLADPLPSGRVTTFASGAAVPVLLGEDDLHDVAVDEDFEIRAGASDGVRLSTHSERLSATPPVDAGRTGAGTRLFRSDLGAVTCAQVSNSRPVAVHVEWRLALDAGDQLVHADHAHQQRKGRTVFALHVAPGQTETIRYQTLRTRYLSPVR